MKAKTKEEFEKRWLDEIHTLYILTHSLTQEDSSKLIVLIHRIEDILKRHTFKVKKDANTKN